MIIAPEVLAKLKADVEAEFTKGMQTEWPQIPLDAERGPLRLPLWLQQWRDERVARILKR